MGYQLLLDPNDRNLPIGSTPNTPPNGILQSGGGIANFVHGGPGRMYDRNSERSDVFGFSLPRNDNVYGNMYSNGASYLESNEPWTHEEKISGSAMPYAWDNSIPRDTPQENLQEGFTQIDFDSSKGPQNLIVVYAMLFILLVSIEMWSYAFSKALKKYVFKRDDLSTWDYCLVGFVMTVTFLGIVYLGEFKFEWF